LPSRNGNLEFNLGKTWGHPNPPTPPPGGGVGAYYRGCYGVVVAGICRNPAFLEMPGFSSIA